MKKRMTALLVLCILLLGMHGVVFAAQSLPEAAQPDLTRKCSITAHLKTFTGEPATDGSIMLIQVSALSEGANGQYYAQNAGFGTLPFDPMEERFEEGTADKLADIAEKNALPYVTAPINTEGIAVFTDLVPGLYLLMQTEAVLESYTAMPPCLMLVPEPQEDGSLAYDADCFPKPVKTIPPIEIEFSGEKIVVCKFGKAPADTLFTFVLTPETPDQPMPKTADAVIDTKNGAVAVTRRGAGAFSFGSMELGQADIGKTYKYTVQEMKGTAQYYTYDLTIFTVTVTVTANEAGEPKADVAIQDHNAKKASRIAFTNTYTPTDVPRIPKTGQLWWPVIVLGAAGALLIGAGLIFRRREEA